MRALITGAGGFVGRRLTDRLREHGHDVVGVDLAADPSRGVLPGDTTAPQTWRQHLDGVDLVVHTAALVGFAGDDDEYWRVNVLGTRRVIEAAAAAGVGRVVHLSSVVAFGFDYPDGVEETWPVRTNGSPYVDTKVASEQVALQAHAAGEVDVTVVRPGDIYGPGSRPWTIEPVREIQAGRMILPAGGEGVLSPVFIDDLVDGVVAAATTPAAAGHVFTITGGRGVTTMEFFTHYCDILRARPPRTVPTGLALPASAVAALLDRLRGHDSEINPATIRYLARSGTYDIDKARDMLGYEPKFGLDEGMARTAAWLRQEGLA